MGNMFARGRRRPGIPLERGREQARAVGRGSGPAFIDGALVYSSPYRRARDLTEIFAGCGLPPPLPRRGLYEDPACARSSMATSPRSRRRSSGSVTAGSITDFGGGEAADRYDRTSSFLESMMRQVERKTAERVLIVTHGLTIRCFVMRFLHLSVGGVRPRSRTRSTVTSSRSRPPRPLTDPLFTSGSWGVSGLRMRPPEED